MPKRAATTTLTVSGPKKKTKNAKYNKRYTSRRPMGQVGLRPGFSYQTGFPKMLRFTHKYVTSFKLTERAGINYDYWWISCNGMYAPEGTFTGHQPYYFDQVTPLYDHYTVIGSRVVWTITRSSPNIGSALTTPIQGACAIMDSSTPLAVGQALQAAEKPSGVPFTIGSLESSQGRVVVEQSWSAKKAFGSATISDPALQGSVASNPTEQQWFYIQINPDPAIPEDIIYVQAEVHYVAVWQELKTVAQS